MAWRPLRSPRVAHVNGKPVVVEADATDECDLCGETYLLVKGHPSCRGSR